VDRSGTEGVEGYNRTVSNPINELPPVTAIEAKIKDGNLAIPSGMVPKHAHPEMDGRWIVHVTGWTGAGEFDNDRFDLYPIAHLPRVTITVASCPFDKHDEDWYSFGKPTKKAIKVNGELIEDATLEP
jgi:hypothetical protein